MKIKNILCFALLLNLTLFFSSCEDLLEVEVKSDITDQVYWQNEGDFQNYLVGTYEYFRDRMNEQAFGEDRSDYYVAGNLSRFSPYWSQVITPENSRDWQQYYALIGHTNLLLHKLESFPFTNQNNKNRIKAEALSLRAAMYFYMAKIYGDVPLILDPIAGEDAPLMARTPVEEIFSQIDQDIEEALTLYPEEGIRDKYYFSKPATNALKADVNLWYAKVLGGGDDALRAAVEAIEQVEMHAGASLLPNFRDITKKKNTEIIFSIYFERSEGEMYAKYALPIQSYSGKAQNANELPIASSANTGYATYTLSPQALALFEQHPEDKRIPATYIAEVQKGTPGYVWPNKFRGSVYSDSRIADDDMIMYRLGGLLLLKAEAHAALGNTQQALQALNRVRERAGIPAFTSNDLTELNKEILDERGRELFHENKRWWDLVRAHHWGTIDVYQTVPNLIGKTTPLYWPVHIRPLSLNPNLVQTEGY